jgi:hypothetical protein
MTPKAFHGLFGRIGWRAKMQFPIHPHMLRHGLRLCPSQCWPRHTRAAGVARPQKHPAHGALHRAGAGHVQELLAIGRDALGSASEQFCGLPLSIGAQRHHRIAELIKVRKNFPVLRYGAPVQRPISNFGLPFALPPAGELIAWSRILDDENRHRHDSHVHADAV